MTTSNCRSHLFADSVSPRMLRREPHICGSFCTIYVLRASHRERAEALEYVQGLAQPLRKKIVKELEHPSRYGPPANSEKWKQLKGTPGICEIEVKPARLMCFFDRPQAVVLTHGFSKKSEKTPPGQIERAIRLQREYQAQTGD